nr:NB-ARC domains-containing protein [Tanacetum cinerariifolium]
MLKKLNFTYCNLVQVPESIGGLSCLEELDLEGNNFTSLPGSLSQLSHLRTLVLVGCKKLEVLPELPPSLWNIYASHCTSLREVSGSSKDPFRRSRVNYLWNCPNLFKNVTIDSEGSISKTQCLDSSITSQGSIHQLSAFLGGWEEAKNFVTFGFEENNEDVEVKEFGVRLICDEDLELEADLSILEKEHMWKVMSLVWIEILAYAATHHNTVHGARDGSGEEDAQYSPPHRLTIGV